MIGAQEVSVYTNARLYWEIARDALQDVERLEKENRRPKPNGEPGEIITYDPKRRSFKQAAVAQTFSCIYFEAVCYIHALTTVGKEEALTIDKKIYEERLKCLGVTDPALRSKAKRLREARKELVHEKALLVDESFPLPMKFMQEEAKFAVAFVEEVALKLKQELPSNSPAGANA